jgi:hypothetical protein
VRDLFTIASGFSAAGDTVHLTFTFLEVYNERITDLLRPPSRPCAAGLPVDLPIREDPAAGVFVPAATAVLATSPSGVLSVLRAASKNRAVAATCCNARSSRSHAVLRFSVLRRTPCPAPGKGGDAGSECNTEKVRRGALTFVDLAGSERLSAVGNPNRPAAAATAREARQINKSISALGNVILALSAGPAGGPPATLAHVPFRDSKLTRLLTGTLGGRAACVLVANVSASPGHAEEAAMTLR